MYKQLNKIMKVQYIIHTLDCAFNDYIAYVKQRWGFILTTW